ncbi:N-acetylneuraminate synthase [bacterium]|nr:MAG: N-acetylneuraminate synthase [bacterium]
MEIILNYSIPKVIAEIGCNHKGDIKIAYELIKLAKDSGADIVKFQKRNNKELLTNEQYNNPHPNSINSYGSTYGEHREFLEFDISQHKLLRNYCQEIDIEYSTSVWDVTSAKEMVSLNPNFLKVPSACNNHFDMLEVLRGEFKGEIHISMGMTTIDEERQIINFFKEKNQNDRLVIYSCTSGYPVPFKDVCLKEINRMYKSYSNMVKSIAFSGHHLGIAIDIVAYTLGAKYIERHFTKDRTWKGTDHAASLEPSGLSKLVRNLDASHKSLTYKNTEILDIEKVQRDKLKFRKK